MIVVSDTSPLNYLVLIQAIDVLPRLFRDIHAPTTVLRELQHSHAPEAVKRWALSPPAWLHVSMPASIPPAVGLLDPGEAAALALAKELGAAAILIDEKKGRRVAKEQGFTTMGTITVLELASQQGLINLNSAFDALARTSFLIAKSLMDAALQRDAAYRLAPKSKTT